MNIEYTLVRDLRSYPNNARTHSKKQIAQKRRLFLKVCLRCGARNALQATRCRKCHASVLRLKNRSVGLKK